MRATWVGPTGASMSESKLLEAEENVPEWFFRMFAGPPHSAVVSLPAKISDLGQIRLDSDSHNEVAEVWEDLALKSGIVLVFAVLLISLVYSALTHALAPLEKLSEALIRVGRGDYAAQVPETGPLELSAIYSEFNRMAHRLAESEQQNRRLNDQLGRVQEEERADIARDLHDEFGPFLFSIDVDARSLRKAGERTSNAEISLGADTIRASVAHMQKHLKSILGRLRPNVLLDLGLSHALDHLLDFWRGRHPHIAFSLAVDRSSYGEAIDNVCYRVVQESVSNAVRHGSPTKVDVDVGAMAGNLMVTVIDNGRGIDPSGSKGFGLAGMGERLAALGGTLEIGALEAGGVCVKAVIPLTKSVHRSAETSIDNPEASSNGAVA